MEFPSTRAAMAGLVGRPVGNADILRRQVGFLVVALDPCVAFTVEVA